MELTVVLPVYNEQSCIADTVSALQSTLVPVYGRGFELIAVDDGSQDNTGALLRGMEGVRVLTHPQNRGKGQAVKTGVQAALGQYIFFTDADLAYPPSAILEGVSLLEGGAGVVAGRRVSDGVPVSAVRRALSGGFTALTRCLGLCVADTQCGFKGFRRTAAALFDRLRITGYAFDVEFLYLAQKYGFRICELPVRLNRAVRPSKVNPLTDSARMAADLARIKYYDLTGKYNLKQ